MSTAEGELLPAFAKVCKWLKINKLSLNTVNSEFMLIGTSQHGLLRDWNSGGQVILQSK